MRIVVTGAKGFVGQHLCAQLPARGHEAIGVDLPFDVTDGDALRALFANEQPDAIIHLAAISMIPDSLDDPTLTYRVNYLGARQVLEATKLEVPNARVLLIGSGHQYGTVPEQGKPFTESAPFLPGSPYATTKAAADLLGGCYAAHGLDVMRVRPFNHTGPGQSDGLVVSSFAKQVTEIQAGLREPLLEVGNLDSVRDFLHVSDVIEAYLALLNPDVPCGAYNIASGAAVRIQDLLDSMTRNLPIKPELRLDPQRFRPTDYAVGDASLLRERTGWAPTIPLSDTIDQLLASWRTALSA